MDKKLAWESYHQTIETGELINSDSFHHLLPSNWCVGKDLKLSTHYLAESYRAMVKKYGEDNTNVE